MKKIVEGIFKPNPTRTEAKGDMTTRVARDILSKEENARILKTERLRAARQAQEDIDGPKPEPVKKPARKASATSLSAGPATSAAKGAAKHAKSPNKTAVKVARPKAG